MGKLRVCLSNYSQFSYNLIVHFVNATIAEAQWLMQTLPSEMFTVSPSDNYAIAEVGSTYAGVQQRWLIVQSKSRQQADLKQLDKRIAQAKTKQAKALKDLSAHPFAFPKGYRSAYETDALEAAKSFGFKLKYHQLTDIEVLKSIKLNDSQKHILRFLGSACQKYYFLC